MNGDSRLLVKIEHILSKAPSTHPSSVVWGRVKPNSLTISCLWFVSWQIGRWASKKRSTNERYILNWRGFWIVIDQYMVLYSLWKHLRNCSEQSHEPYFRITKCFDKSVGIIRNKFWLILILYELTVPASNACSQLQIDLIWFVEQRELVLLVIESTLLWESPETKT